MLPQNVLYYGKEEPLPERVELRAGPLRLFFEDGDLRSLCWGEYEVLRRVYVAVRDHNWGTVPPVISNLKIQTSEDAFHITFQVENRQGEIDFAWQGVITGNTEGTVEYRMDGVARSTFLCNRIGFCVLYPAGCAGAVCLIEHIDSSCERGKFPHWISPDQPVPPFSELRALTQWVAARQWMEVRFRGDIFEMEDQRNWTDASYKVYSTPLRLPFPVELPAGACIAQSITLRLIDKRPPERVRVVSHHEDRSPVEISLDLDSPGAPFPPLGLCVASHGQPLSEKEIERLAALHLDHLRVDLPLEDQAYPVRLARAAGEARRLDLPLHVALLIPPDGDQALESFTQTLDQIRPRISVWLVYPARENYHGGSPTRHVVALARKYLETKYPGAIFAAGTNADYIFLARTPPPVDILERITFALHPQAHAFDNLSLIETLEGQSAALASAKRLAGSLPVMISPITLKPRFNPYATALEPEASPGKLPVQVDPRQMALLGAGWTLGSLKALAEGGACSLTYYETTGWRGMMEMDGGSPLPQVFRSIPGGVFPLYHVLAEVREFSGSQVIPGKTSDGLRAGCIALRNAGGVRLLIANFTPEKQSIWVSLPYRTIRVRTLDETNAVEAMGSPEAFRAQPGTQLQPQEEILRLEMLPYAIARLEFNEPFHRGF